MSAKRDGGPAFPVATLTEGCGYGHRDGDGVWQFGGMTLRDYLAAKAMLGILSAPQEGPTMEADRKTPCVTMADIQRRIAELAYGYADAMLIERIK